MATFFVFAFVVPAISHLTATDRNAGLPPTQVTVDFQVRTDVVNTDARLAQWVNDNAAQFEARLIASRSWPGDLRVTGTTDGCSRSCGQSEGAHMQVRSAQQLSPEAVRLALGAGRITFERVVDPTPHPCTSGDTAHIKIVQSAANESGCLRTDQYELRLVRNPSLDDPCSSWSPTDAASVTSYVTIDGGDAQWLEQWAVLHPHSELVMMADWTAIGVVKTSQVIPGKAMILLPTFTVQPAVACGLFTEVGGAEGQSLVEIGYFVH